MNINNYRNGDTCIVVTMYDLLRAFNRDSCITSNANIELILCIVDEIMIYYTLTGAQTMYNQKGLSDILGKYRKHN